MRFESAGRKALLAALLATGLLLFGCAGAEEASISPLPTGSDSSELGPGVRPLSFGPGYKGSPNWSRDGERISFTVDGYAVDKPRRGGEQRRWTARDFGAGEIESSAEGTMIVLGEDGENEDEANTEADETGSLYRATPSGDSPTATEISSATLAAAPFDEGGSLLAAIESGPDESVLALVRPDGVERTFGEPIEGSVAGLSLSPNQRRAALAVIPPGEETATELRTFDLASGSVREIASLDDERQIFGSPQWTRRGVYYVVAGTEGGGGEDSSLYELYRVPAGAGEPELAPGVGGDFAASGIKASPDGTRLAIIGRLHANSSTNLHILDTRSDTLSAATSSEDMEIKNGSEDMAWAPDGESVAIVARGSFSSPRVKAASADSLLDEFYNLYEVPVVVEGA